MKNLTTGTDNDTMAIVTDWLTVREAAKESGYNFQHIRRLCRAKRLKCVLKGGIYLIDPESLGDYVDLMKRLGTEKHHPERPWAND